MRIQSGGNAWSGGWWTAPCFSFYGRSPASPEEKPLTFARRSTFPCIVVALFRRPVMAEAKAAKAPTVSPMVRYTPAEVARNKKARDVRRKSIRAQNASSRMK